ncbi:LysM peptidoglycan-binding domain-containing protein [Paenibacillus agricola]|uniref:LysM peptidoglycan-binding domain-containing protein n=1 Tax=Paenibacillus agricola TaxID=2716264 RepID=UPI001A9F9B29|nr:LysM domain-containing protein [Paenibacillus agricola]
MDRAYGYGGFGQFGAPFNPYFFPRRRFVPFFFLSPFFFPFFRGEEDRDGTYFAKHQCMHGDTMGALAQQYNVPQPILEAMNPHIQNPKALEPGSITYIPRMDKMYCHRMYIEQEGQEHQGATPSPQHSHHSHYPQHSQQPTMTDFRNPAKNPNAAFTQPVYPYAHIPQYPGVYPSGAGSQGGHGLGVHAGGYIGGHDMGVHAGGHLGGYGVGVHAGGHLDGHGVGVQTGGHLGSHDLGVHAGGKFDSHGVDLHTGGHIDQYAAGVNTGIHLDKNGLNVQAGGQLDGPDKKMT